VPNGTIEQNGVGKMNKINNKVLKSIKDLGVTHVWYTGVIEHATKTDYSAYGITPDNPHVVKGNAGSPYAIKDYYDIDPDIAEDVPNRMKEFEELVKRTHDNGMKVIIDFVPNHVARQYHSDVKPQGIEDFGVGDDPNMMFTPNNNFYYITRQVFSPYFDLGSGKDAYFEFPAKATGNDCFSAFPSVNDWYETVKLNYGVDYGNGSRHFDPIPDTWFKMVNILRFWASKGIDAFRCDMVFMVPVEFWGWAIPLVKEKYPHIKFIAEIYDVNIYRDYIYNGHFDYLYDKVSLYDTLRGVQCCNISAASITNCWQTVDGINDNMLNFLENHDEQRFASEQYAGNAHIVSPSLVVCSTISRAPMMIYQGQELGEKAADAEGFSGLDGRTTIFDYWSIPTVNRWYNNGKCDGKLLTEEELKLRNLYKHILTMCNKEKAISDGEFFDLMYVNYNNINPHRHYTYLRHFEDETLLIAVNFGDEAADIDINIPAHAFDYLKIMQGDYNGKELLSGEKGKFKLSSSTPFHTEIEPFSAVIWKLTPRKTKKS
jgi:glycosidase